MLFLECYGNNLNAYIVYFKALHKPNDDEGGKITKPISFETGFILFIVQIGHHQKIFQLDVPHDACGIVDIIVGYQNLLRKIVYALERLKLTLVSLVLGYTVCDLNIILFVSGLSQKVNLLTGVIVHPKVVAHIYKLIIDDVFQIVSEVKSVIHNIDAGKYSRVKELNKKILFCTVVIGLAATLLFELAPGRSRTTEAA